MRGGRRVENRRDGHLLSPSTLQRLDRGRGKREERRERQIEREREEMIRKHRTVRLASSLLGTRRGGTNEIKIPLPRVSPCNFPEHGHFATAPAAPDISSGQD